MQRFPGLTPPGWARSQAFTVSERERGPARCTASLSSKRLPGYGGASSCGEFKGFQNLL